MTETRFWSPKQWMLRFFRNNVGSSSDMDSIEQSEFFDSEWYRGKLADGIAFDEHSLLLHYLREGWRLGLSPGPKFDGEWYLRAYPDVAAAGMNPLVHYLRFGRAEGRLPRKNRALAWEHHLWVGVDDLMVPRLRSLFNDPEATPEEVGYAAWALARWFAWRDEWATARDVLFRYQDLDAPYPAHLGPVLLAADALWRTGAGEEADVLLSRWLAREPGKVDLYLARANLLSEVGQGQSAASREDRLELINGPLRSNGLSPVALRDSSGALALDNLKGTSGPATASASGPRVSVIMPVYNAADIVTTALESLFEQTWANLEVIVVDDASTDGTWDVLQQVASRCPAHHQLQLLHHDQNGGAYVARNTGLAAASGELITSHDSDDWSHPEKIERQVQALMEDSAAKACVSHWVRATPNLIFQHWQIEEGWTYRNVSSLMFRREVFEALGFWDRVKVGGDTEYYDRIPAAFGDDAIIEVLPGVPLAFGRADAGSLSQHSDTHLVTQFSGVRKDYIDAARRWHGLVSLQGGNQVTTALYMPARPLSRRFPAPAAINRGTTAVNRSHPLDTIQQSGLFDAAWYVRTYPDVQGQIIDPVEHYYDHGAGEGREPGPDFSGTGYACAYLHPENEVNPLVHFLQTGRGQGFNPLPEFPGDQPRGEGNETILVCAHAAAQQLFGAERSLLDLVEGLNRLDFNVLIALPGAANRDYLSTLRARAHRVFVLPYGWWHADRLRCMTTQTRFEEIIRTHNVDALHANTSVLFEPLLAARQCGIPAVVHVREMPGRDPDLCRRLGGKPDVVRESVLSSADHIIANSEITACYFAKPGRTYVVPNTVDTAALDIPQKTDYQAVNFALISSNIRKKGVFDLVEVAKLMIDVPSARFLLIGPDSDEIAELKIKQARGEVPESVVFAGYAPSPIEALRQADVVLNLSNCEESFGRTVLEAMTARRPVIAYRLGAIPELVRHDETGFLVEFGDTDAVAVKVRWLCNNPSQMRRLGEAGRRIALAEYAPASYEKRLYAAYSQILN